MMASSETTCDVLVVGSGLAGCMAAIAAAEEGARVALASTGSLFSGSSFFEGTWGLGCIAPNSPDDEEDLVQTVLKVGCGVADEQLARTLVHSISPALDDLECRGVALRKPDAGAEREYIPCFDHAHRVWRGLERTSLRQVFARELERLGVSLLPACTLLDIIEEGQERVGDAPAEHTRVAGAALLDARTGRPFAVASPAVVLATGGMGGLYGHRLTRPDCLGSAQAIALAHGEKLTNIEFLQIMPTFITPAGPVVFNERTFRFSTLSVPVDEALLDERSTYGPFTTRLASSAIDLAIAQAEEPVFVKVDRLPAREPEFIATYRSWFERTTGLSLDAPVEIRHFAHASNGGIAVRADGSCLLPGLFAAGECTGGMHGADRIGGLASANALVFGRLAGKSAAAVTAGTAPFVALKMGELGSRALDHALGEILDQHALVIRTEKGLATAEDKLFALEPSLQRTSALALVSAMRARTKSLGSHYRADEAAV